MRHLKSTKQSPKQFNGKERSYTVMCHFDIKGSESAEEIADRIFEIAYRAKKHRLDRSCQSTAEAEIAMIEKEICESESETLILAYCELILSESLFWLSEHEKSEKEAFLCRYLYRIPLSEETKCHTLNHIRSRAKQMYPNNFARYFAISLGARDILYNPFAVSPVSISPFTCKSANRVNRDDKQS